MLPSDGYRSGFLFYFFLFSENYPTFRKQFCDSCFFSFFFTNFHSVTYIGYVVGFFSVACLTHSAAFHTPFCSVNIPFLYIYRSMWQIQNVFKRRTQLCSGTVLCLCGNVQFDLSYICFAVWSRSSQKKKKHFWIWAVFHRTGFLLVLFQGVHRKPVLRRPKDSLSRWNDSCK